MSDPVRGVQRKVNVPNVNLPPLADSVRRNSSQNTAPAAAPVAQAPPVPAVQAPPAPSPVHDSANETANRSPVEIQEMEIAQEKTYLSLGNKAHGFVEFDLMSHRERGKEARYMNIQVNGLSLDEQGVAGNASMAITSKDDFDKVKEFFSALQWED